MPLAEVALEQSAAGWENTVVACVHVLACLPMQRPKVIPSNPAWEAMKAARRNLGHDEAVQDVDFLHRRVRQLWGHSVSPSPVDLNTILRTLIQKRIPFVLTGAHGIAGWTGRPRSTQDVDILAKAGRNHARAVKAIRELYPQLEIRTFTGLTAFFVPGETDSVIDVVCPHRAHQEATLANPVWTYNKEHGIRCRIPALDTALANKYGAMLTLSRDAGKRRLDAADFGQMVRHSMDLDRTNIDLNWLAAPGEKVWPGGGGKEILHLIEQVKAGQPIHLKGRA